MLALHAVVALTTGIGGPVSHGSHPDLTNVAPARVDGEGKTEKQLLDEGHLPHNILSEERHMEAYRKHREHAGDTIGRMNRGQGHWATVTDDQFSRLRGLPNVPRESGASSERNPEYDRQLLGFDLHHPSLPFWRTVTGDSLNELVGAMMTVVDADSSGDIDRQELKMYIRSVARVRIMETTKWLLPQLVKHATSDFALVHIAPPGQDPAADRGAELAEVEHMHQHDDPHRAHLLPTAAAFAFSDVDGDGFLDREQFVLYSFVVHNERAVNDVEQDFIGGIGYEGSVALLRACDDNGDGRLSHVELLEHFPHFVVATASKAASGVGGRGGMAGIPGRSAVHAHSEL